MGALLRGIKREQIRRGQVLAAPGTIKAAKQFLAQIYVGFISFSLSFVITCMVKGFDQGRR